MENLYATLRSPEYLEHHGILGMKWGIRRFQNPDGSLTEEGRKRYGDILTKDQMKGMIRGYNLRTGKNLKITKKTTFKTDHGTYDYKGHRIDVDTDVDDKNEESEKKTSTKKSYKDMTDEELKAANERMKQEIDYITKYNQLNPKQVSLSRQFVANLTSHMIEDIPAGISTGIKNYLASEITQQAKKSDKKEDKKEDKKDKKEEKKTEEQQPKQEQPKTKTENNPKEETPKQNSSNATRMVSDLPDVGSSSVRSLFYPHNNSADHLSTNIASKKVDDINYDVDDEWFWRQFKD